MAPMDVQFEEQESQEQTPEPQAQPRVSSHGHPSGSDAAAEKGMADAARAFVASRETVTNERTQKIQAELDSILKDKTNPMHKAYWDAFDPKGPAQRAARQRVTELQQQLAGEQHQAQRAELPPDQQPTEVLKDAPEGWSRDDEVAARSFAVELGVPAPMVNGALEAMARGGQALQFETADALESAARSRWGNDYDAKLYHARLAVQSVGPEFADLLDRTGAGNNLALMEHLAQVGETLEQTQQEINALQKNPAYLDSSHLDHRAALQTMKTLQETRHFLKRDLR